MSARWSARPSAFGGVGERRSALRGLRHRLSRYVAGRGYGDDAFTPVSVDLKGEQTPFAILPDKYGSARWAPDGKSIAIDVSRDSTYYLDTRRESVTLDAPLDVRWEVWGRGPDA
jgi:hypothetical protein